MTESEQTANQAVPGSVAAWEERYSGTEESIWSGNPNESLVATVSDLAPGRVLDVGCGEGADVIWLVEHGWEATGIDLSQTAVDRAAEAASARGVTANFEVGDISTWNDPEPHRGGFDLVVGCFLHTRLPDTREELVGKVAEHVAPGGGLLLVSHAEMPPWAENLDEELGEGLGHHHEPVSPNGDFALLIGGSPKRWEIELAELRTREAEGPDGELAELDDSVLLARRITD
ncbi:methyltransferase domain-containing protein [Brevibacterium marinum]|uniref:SAM-dependent methyltransferase n=1 Tax=Brevibacterium marinum TaxID=418643 RepID=A0A846S493_9MICO|nr:SAM-dependent methyltransferase [Brevibacterium marinum]